MSTEPTPHRERSTRPVLAGLLLLLLIGGGALYWREPSRTVSAPPAPVAPLAATQTPSAPAPVAAVPSITPPPVAPPSVVPTQSAAAPIMPSFDIVRVTPEGSAVIAGRAAPGADVIVRDGDRVVGSAKADRNGEFVIVPNERLPTGGRELTLGAHNPDGTDVAGLDAVVVMVPERRAPEPQVATATPETREVPAPALALLVPHDAEPRLIQPQAGKKDELALNTVDYDERGNIRFSGAAKPTASVRVYVDNTRAGETSSDAAGQWSLTPSDAVAPGVHQLRVDQLGADGQVLHRVELPFQRTETAPEGLTAGHAVVQPGQNLWRIARASYGQGTRYTVIYLANRAQIRNPNLIYPGQVFAVPGGE